MIGQDQAGQLIGRTAYDTSGEKIGTIQQVFLDDQTGQPEFATITTGWFGSSESFVPLRDVEVQGDRVTVPYDKDTVKNAPRIGDEDGHLEPEEEDELYRYYDSAGTTGTDAVATEPPSADSQSTSSTFVGDQAQFSDEGRADYADTDVRPGEAQVRSDADHDTSRPPTSGSEPVRQGTTDAGMTRSEEELRISKEREVKTRARLRKYVVTENVTMTVPVRREKVRLEHEPIPEGETVESVEDLGEGSGTPVPDAGQEIILSEERVLIDKEVVPVERVRLAKEVVTEEREVTEEVRKEQVELETDGSAGAQPRSSTDPGADRA